MPGSFLWWLYYCSWMTQNVWLKLVSYGENCFRIIIVGCGLALRSLEHENEVHCIKKEFRADSAFQNQGVVWRETLSYRSQRDDI